MKVRLADALKVEFELSTVADWRLFDALARAIDESFEGAWVERIDGPDERFWDFRQGDAVVTLHLQHYLGILLFPNAHAGAAEASAHLTRRIAELLESHEPQSP